MLRELGLALVGVAREYDPRRVDAASGYLRFAVRRDDDHEIGTAIEAPDQIVERADDQSVFLPNAQLHAKVGKDVPHVDDEPSAVPNGADEARKRNGDRRRADHDDVVSLAREEEIERRRGRGREPMQQTPARHFRY